MEDVKGKMTTYYDHQCMKCGRLWYTRHSGYRVCPGCTKVPWLRGVWLRLRYRVTKRGWGKMWLGFIPHAWSPDTMDAIDARIELGNLLLGDQQQDLIMKTGSTIRVPKYDSLRREP